LLAHIVVAEKGHGRAHALSFDARTTPAARCVAFCYGIIGRRGSTVICDDRIRHVAIVCHRHITHAAVTQFNRVDRVYISARIARTKLCAIEIERDRTCRRDHDDRQPW
jgi:hypothetical protein